MKLPYAPQGYDQGDQQRARSLTEQADQQNLKRDRDIELQPSQRLIISSPNGSRWYITVSDVGVVGATAI